MTKAYILRENIPAEFRELTSQFRLKIRIYIKKNAYVSKLAKRFFPTNYFLSLFFVYLELYIFNKPFLFSINFCNMVIINDL